MWYCDTVLLLQFVVWYWAIVVDYVWLLTDWLTGIVLLNPIVGDVCCYLVFDRCWTFCWWFITAYVYVGYYSYDYDCCWCWWYGAIASYNWHTFTARWWFTIWFWLHWPADIIICWLLILLCYWPIVASIQLVILDYCIVYCY